MLDNIERYKIKTIEFQGEIKLISPSNLLHNRKSIDKFYLFIPSIENISTKIELDDIDIVSYLYLYKNLKELNFDFTENFNLINCSEFNDIKYLNKVKIQFIKYFKLNSNNSVKITLKYNKEEYTFEYKQQNPNIIEKFSFLNLDFRWKNRFINFIIEKKNFDVNEINKIDDSSIDNLYKDFYFYLRK